MEALEVGCGDGSHSIAYAARVTRLVGIDIATSLVAQAKERATSASARNVSFEVGSVLHLEDTFPAEAFHAVVSQRCLINLPDWQHQQEALRQIHRVLRPGGLLLLSEGFQGELDALNQFRAQVGLEEIGVVPFNRNFVREDFESFVLGRFSLIERRDYGLYLVLSRVLHPLAVRPDAPAHDSQINEAAMLVARAIELPSLARFSYDLFYALRRA